VPIKYFGQFVSLLVFADFKHSHLNNLILLFNVRDFGSDETFSMDPSNFQCIYPSYLDSTKTVSKGRRIASEKAVPVPTVSDISQALQSLNIRHVLQPHKGYSRDIESLWDNPGRIMYEPDDVYTKRELIVEVASKVEALPSRIQRLEQEKIQAEIEKKNAEEATQRERQAKKQQKQLQQQSSKSSKKKGKKRR
jgi:signal recognition particle subunit SRP19